MVSGEDFAEQLAAPTPTPGGGAAAARVALYSSSLVRMVLGISSARLEAGDLREKLEETRVEAERLAQRFRALEWEDVTAFEAFMKAVRLPRQSDREKAVRRRARSEAALQATQVPLRLLEAVRDVLSLIERLRATARGGELRAESDLVGAAELALAAFRLAEHTVRANDGELSREDAEEARSRAQSLRSEVDRLYRELRPAEP